MWVLLYHAQTTSAQVIFTCPVCQEHWIAALLGCKCVYKLRGAA